jgi:hypothetical protein
VNTSVVFEGQLQYYIYYSSDEELIISIISWCIFVIVCIALASGFAYEYYIGEGRNWKPLEILQLIAAIRYLNFRYGLNLELILERLNYFNVSFIYNYFEIFISDQGTD